jgi:CRP-like cAMP-binding protein
MLLWQLAGRWGRVTGEGVRLPLPLSHGTLAELVAARRPSVTTALGRLVAEGVVRDERGGWLLQGERPAELSEMGTLAGPPGSSGADPVSAS